MAALTATQATAAKSAQLQLKSYPKVATALAGSVTVGPFVIKYSMTGNAVTVTASVQFGPLKKKLFTTTLTVKKKCHTVSVNAGVVKVSLTVCADFSKMQIVITGQACVRKVFGGWSCKKFSKKIG